MSITQVVYTGNGSTTLYSVPFEYIRESDVLVLVDEVQTPVTFVNPNTVQFAVAPAAGSQIRIYRKTYIDEPDVEFTAGSAIRARDLNGAIEQILFSVQEWRDQTVPLYDAVLPDDIDMGGNQINNMAEPSLPGDAATKNYVDSTTWNVTDETTQSTETWNSVDSQIATNKAVDQRVDFKIEEALDATAITTAQQDAGNPSWENNDDRFPTAGASAKRFDTLVQPSTPSGSDWQVGKSWLQNDQDTTLSIWDGVAWRGVASGGTFTTQPTVIYVDSFNGDDANDGHRIINPKKTIKNAVASANAGDIIRVVPGVYQEVLPIDITVSNLSIVGEAQRSCFIHPTPATETQTMFRCNSGTYIDGFTFVGLKASGARGAHPVDNDPIYGLPENQGWVAGFYPGCVIRKSPYINNCTVFSDSGIDNSNFDPNNYTGTGGDITSAPSGGGIIVDGSVPDVSSPLRSFVINEFTQLNLDGPGLLVANNGYAQAVSFFGLFCHYHAKALSGGQINMEVGTTDFGRYGLIADGYSSTPIFTASTNGAASAGDITFAINAPFATPSWFGNANRPALNMLVRIGSNFYPILSSTPNGSGWNVTISNPDPNNRVDNLGLVNSHPNGLTVQFYLRSMISTASHTMEYAGSGTDYRALPENGGVPVEANESINRNHGRVWLTSTDQSGKFKVGDTFQVDQESGLVSVDPTAFSVNVVSDLTPQLGGDLDVLDKKITTSLTNGNVVLEANGSGRLLLNSVIERGTFSGGTAGAPSITFTGDINTGLFTPGADILGFATGGLERARIDSTGRFSVTALASANGNAFRSAHRFADIGTGLTQIGSAAPYITTCNGLNSQLNVPAIAINSDNFGSGNCGLQFELNRLLVSGSVSNNDRLGRFSFGGDDGTNIVAAARIDAFVDGDPGTNDMPGRIVFSTTPDGSSNPVERVRITSTGQLRLAGAGVTFNGDSAAANELDDYEEGTFTPTIVGTTTEGVGTYSVQDGSYTKIGNRVLFQAKLVWSAHTGTGNLRISGLPFTSRNTAHRESAIYSNISNLSLSASHYQQAYIPINSTQIVFEQVPTGGGAASAVPIDTAASIWVTGQYSV